MGVRRIDLDPIRHGRDERARRRAARGHRHGLPHTNTGIIAPGNSIGTLPVSGDHHGNGGTLEIETVLGGDASPTDRLAITGSTSGSTNVRVNNLGVAVSAENLRDQAFSGAIVTAVEALTRAERATYNGYVLRAAANEFARPVKSLT